LAGSTAITTITVVRLNAEQSACSRIFGSVFNMITALTMHCFNSISRWNHNI